MTKREYMYTYSFDFKPLIFIKEFHILKEYLASLTQISS